MRTRGLQPMASDTLTPFAALYPEDQRKPLEERAAAGAQLLRQQVRDLAGYLLRLERAGDVQSKAELQTVLGSLAQELHKRGINVRDSRLFASNPVGYCKSLDPVCVC